jgi:hypothetical protein
VLTSLRGVRRRENQAIQKRFPSVRMHLLSPEMVNWELDVYFAMMTLTVKLGLAPMTVIDARSSPLFDIHH